MSSIIQELLLIMNEMLTVENEEALSSIHASQKLKDDLLLDSFRLAELTVRIEHKFGIDIFEDGYVVTIQDVIDKLASGRSRT
ncbi:phosphopantetheine-binding protein [Paenibacillus kobensis]|uniref:phosphopantetheine-binding protein n=1 Tax=Paenibacillus kobensis TaxID=59841 RepID=UPI001FE76019|nr:phosphopantetheine-binding protein [Paenibacillus kobensis]